MIEQAESYSDANLVERLAAGEDLALDIIMNRYQERVYYFILRYVHDEDLAYDLVQETFLRVYTRIEKYNSRFRFSTWLFQIALNLCRDYGRKRGLRKFFSLSGSNEGKSVQTVLVNDTNVEQDFDTDSDIKELHHHIANLPHKLKAPLILFALEEKSQAVCSEILGISRKAVETRVYRARKILEKKMRKASEGKV